MSHWQRVLDQAPLMAILRGIQPSEAIVIADALIEAGFICAEVPLNSPDAFVTIERMRMHSNHSLFVGAGTVLTVQDVSRAAGAGAEFIVSPNTNPAVIAATKQLALKSVPGFATPTEAFTAIEAGADALKLFPAENTGPAVVRALKAVLPSSIPVFAVGSITPESMHLYRDAGTAGFGIGSAIFKPGSDAATVRENARKFLMSWRALHD